MFSAKAQFISPMLLLATDRLPEGAKWAYELRLDGYRAIAFKTGSEVYIRSWNNKGFNQRYGAIAKALDAIPGETVIDGEVVALDDSGRPDFNSLQSYGSSKTLLLYHVFDVNLRGRRPRPVLLMDLLNLMTYVCAAAGRNKISTCRAHESWLCCTYLSRA